ncbi:MAG: hypothetical protein J0M33_00290 [Anaerolineae bacterium]|nr:hypothetical protein [Anaerolineae bacterium]
MRALANVPPIALEVHLPPNGSYPPRIVAPGVSLWLRPGDGPLKIRPFLEAENTGQGCILYATSDREVVMVNGHPLVGQHRLQDGDFLHTESKRLRAIFQQDPVADQRALSERSAPADRKTSLTPSDKLRKAVQIDSEGISLNGGKDRATWGRETAIYFYFEHTSNLFFVQVWCQTEKRREKGLPSQCRSLGGDEAGTLLNWLTYAAPYALSYRSNALAFSDVYTMLTEQHIIKPALAHQRLLPASIALIRGYPSRMQSLISLMVVLSYGVVVSGVLFIIFDAAFKLPNVTLLLFVGVSLLFLRRNISDAIYNFRTALQYESLDVHDVPDMERP